MRTSYKVDGFNNRLRQAVADSNRTLSDISHSSGVTRGCLWSYLTGDVNPSIYTLARLATTLNVSSDWLLGIGGRNE